VEGHLQPAEIAEGESLFDPAVEGHLQPVELAEGESLAVPSVEAALQPAVLAEGESLAAPSVEAALQPAEITEGESLTAPSVEAALQPAEITEGESLYHPVAERALQPTEISEGEILKAPTVIDVYYGGPYSYVQSAGNQSAVSALSGAVTLGAAAAAGNVVLVFLTLSSTLESNVVLTDAGSNTWTLLYTGPSNNPSTAKTYVFGCLGIVGSLTVALTCHWSSVACLSAIAAVEFRPTNFGQAVVDQKNGAASNSTSVSSGSVTTAAVGELYVAAVGLPGVSGTQTVTQPTGWNGRVIEEPTSSKVGIALASMGEGGAVSAGTYSATWTLALLEATSGVIVSLK
jgi:hypothetical protein